jgi:hypothetical protein
VPIEADGASAHDARTAAIRRLVDGHANGPGEVFGSEKTAGGPAHTLPWLERLQVRTIRRPPPATTSESPVARPLPDEGSIPVIRCRSSANSFRMLFLNP